MAALHIREDRLNTDNGREMVKASLAGMDASVN